MDYKEHELMTKSLKSVRVSYGHKIETNIITQESKISSKPVCAKLSQDEMERLEYDLEDDLLMGEDAFNYRGVSL